VGRTEPLGRSLSSAAAVDPGGPKSAAATGSLVKVVNLLDACTDYGLDHELRNSHSARNRERFVTQVDEYNPNFSPIIRVNGSRRVKNGDSVSECEARTGPNLPLRAQWKRNCEPRRD
jgi:hypothetical protein